MSFAEGESFSSISAVLTALSAVLLGAIFVGRRRRPAHRALLWLCMNVLLYHLSSVVRGGERLPYMALAIQMVLPVSLLDFLRTWLSDTSDAPRRIGPQRTALFLLLLGELTLAYAYSTRSAAQAQWTQHVPGLLRAATLAALYVALSPLWNAYRSTLSRIDKRRLLYLLGFGALTITASALDYLPPPLGRGSPAIGSLLTVAYLYFLQQTLFMDRLLDINELLGRLVVLSAFVLLLSALQTVLTLLRVQPQQAVTVVAFLILLLYEPLRISLERQVQRITSRERHELQQALSELRQVLVNVIDAHEAVRLLIAVFEETRRLTHASVYLLEADGGGYELVGHFGSRPVERLDVAARRPLLSRLVLVRQPVTLDRLQQEQQQLANNDAAESENLDAIGRALVELQASAVLGIYRTGPEQQAARRSTSGLIRRDGAGSTTGGLPAVARPASSDPPGQNHAPSEVLLGVLCIKDRSPVQIESFTAGELDVYAGVAGQLAITLQNSHLYARMKEHDRLAALGQMAAGLAHEIRNPLGAIKGAAELIAPGSDGRLPQDEDSADFVRIILEETRRLGRVVSQFLDYARPLRGDYQPVDINEVVQRTESLLRPLCAELWQKAERPPGVGQPAIVLELAPELPELRGDADQLNQVFLNLGLNALQAMANQPPETERRTTSQLTISTGLRQGGRLGTAAQHVEVRFTDTGPGIDPAVQKNLFIPFFTTKEKGTGLGLPISQRIIENHDGFIEVRSRSGTSKTDTGSTFIVALPVV